MKSNLMMRAGLCLAGILFLAGTLAAQAPTWNASARQLGKTAPVHYVLDLTHPSDHLARVSITVAASGPATEFSMPEFYPGENSNFDLPVDVHQTSAACQTGEQASPSDAALPVMRSDSDSWRVENGSCKRVRFEYRVFGNNVHVIYSQIDSTHGYINGPTVFMYEKDHKQDSVMLDVRAPQGWKVISQLGDMNQATGLTFANYDIFIDTPLEAAPNITLDQFQEGGKTFRVVIHTFAPVADYEANKAKLIEGMRTIAQRETAVVGADDLDTFTYFIHFNAQTASDGQEHLYGLQLTINGGLESPAILQATLNLAAHGFFHHWMMKRIRPAALGPWNYEGNNPTPSMWDAEGFDTYYGNLTMVRVGLVTSDAFLQRMATSLGNSLTQPGYKYQSAVDTSYATWFAPARTGENIDTSTTTVAFNTRGEQLAFVLDLDLRARTHGQRSLDDVVRYLWKNTYMAPNAASYYIRGRGFTEDDVLKGLASAGGTSYTDFYSNYISGTKPIPYDQYLAPFGLKLDCTAPASPASYTGLHVQGNDILAVDIDSPADEAGFGSGDVIQSVGGQPVAAAPPATAAGRGGGRGGRGGAGPFANSAPGTAVSVQVVRHDEPVTLSLTPQAPLATSCKMADVANPTDAQKQLREAWLK